MPADINYSLETLKNFMNKHDKPPVIAFYGGEPTISLEDMKWIMDNIKTEAFIIQTNGTRLDRVPEDYIRRFHTILISIDGVEEHTDHFRGKNTYKRALEGIKYAIQSGFDGDTVARMTVTTMSDIYRDVKHLLNLGIFKHVHWQLDAMWDFPDEEELNNFEKWQQDSYHPGLIKLVDEWIKTMVDQCIVQGIAPFQGIMYTLIKKEKVGLRCGAGIDFFAVTTDGRITACPIPPSIVFPVLGDIQTSTPKNLPGQIHIEEPCTKCNYLDICGGRCLYTNKTKHWGPRGFNMVCNSTKFLIDLLRSHLSTVLELIDKGCINIDDFNYPKLANGVETIP